MIAENVVHVLTPGLLEACDDEKMRDYLVYKYEFSKSRDWTFLFIYEGDKISHHFVSNQAIVYANFDLLSMAKAELYRKFKEGL